MNVEELKRVTARFMCSLTEWCPVRMIMGVYADFAGLFAPAKSAKLSFHPLLKGPQADFLQISREFNWAADVARLAMQMWHCRGYYECVKQLLMVCMTKACRGSVQKSRGWNFGFSLYKPGESPRL